MKANVDDIDSIRSWLDVNPDMAHALLSTSGNLKSELLPIALSFLPTIYKHEGIKVEDCILGNHERLKTAFAHIHDGVQYVIDSRGSLDVVQYADNLKLVISRHHSVVKKIYEYCVSLNVGDIWALSGGGCQLQVLFGNHAGYLAVLYLDMNESPMGIAYSKNQASSWKLQIAQSKYDDPFSQLNLSDIDICTWRSFNG